MKIKCNNCGAEVETSDTAMTAQCPFCDSSSVIQRPERDVPSPSFAIGFSQEREKAERTLAEWLRKRRNFLQINIDFVLDALPKALKGIYLPSYIFGAEAQVDYTARIGEIYYETETYRDSEGHLQTRQVQRTEWFNLNGDMTKYISDVLVSASTGVSNELLNEVEPYDYLRLRRFDPRITSGWLAEIPTRTSHDIAEAVKNDAREEIRNRLRSIMPGDSLSSLDFDCSIRNTSLHLALVPIWSLRVPVPNGNETLHFLMNGQTGRCGGKIPYSGVRVFTFVMAILGICGGFFLMLSN